MVSGTRRARSRGTAAALAVLGAGALIVAACIPPPTGGNPPPPPDGALPPVPEEPALIEVPMITGLSQPVSVEFAADGRVFVAEKRGVIRTFDSIADPTPSTTIDLTTEVRNAGDHGFLGLAVDPQWPLRPYVYAMYTWDVTGLWGNSCKAGYALNGCVTGGRLQRIETDSTGVAVEPPVTLEQDRWCFQFSSHGVGDIEFLPDGSMLVGAGDGASWSNTDYGQFGGVQLIPPVPNLTPRNPCGDPPDGVGASISPITSEGGAFRAQGLLTENLPLWWTGALVRLDPDTGEPPADNPLVGDPYTADDAHLAHGLRNPYRMTVKPGTSQVYIGDVGYNQFEEINLLDVGTDPVRNFGWPCWEGPRTQPAYGTLGNNLCALAASPTARTTLTEPWFHYPRTFPSGAVSGIEYLPSTGRYAPWMSDAIVFADYVRGAVYHVPIEPDGSASDQVTSVARAGVPVDVELGPDGYLYTVDLVAGTVNRLVDRNSVPVARLQASATAGPLPLVVDLDASSSSQAGNGLLTFEWDLTGDGDFGDAVGPTAQVVLTEPENLTVSVRVTNEENASAVASVTLYPGNTAPQVSIDVTSPLPWSANDTIEFEITATDAEDGVVPAAAVSWVAELHHCYAPDDCHMHPYTDATGSLGDTIEGPSHGYPSFLKLLATATDSRGQSTTTEVDLHPATVQLQVTSTPSGAHVGVGENSYVTPFTVTVVRNDTLTLNAVSPQQIAGVPHVFASWGHGGDVSHSYFAGDDASLHVDYEVE